MKNKKKLIIIGIVIILSIILIFLIINMVKSNNKNSANYDFKKALNDANSIENKTRQVIDSVNYVNTIFKKTEFDDNIKYDDCLKYIGKDSDMYINILRTVYSNPFTNSNFFKLKYIDDSEELYICKPNCNTKEILIENIRIKNGNNNDNKIITIDEKDYELKKIDDMWKLDSPIVLCENE